MKKKKSAKKKKHNIYTVAKDLITDKKLDKKQSAPGNIYEAFGLKEKKVQPPKKKAVKKKTKYGTLE